MIKQIPAIIGWLLLAIAFGIYLYGVYYAIFIPDPVYDNARKLIGYTIPEPLATLTTTIGAILLTNLGAVLGISVSQPESALAGKTLISRKIKEEPPPLTKRELIQFAAVLIYIVTLLACFITWAHASFRNEDDIKPVVPLVEQYGKTLIGVITAYIAFVLGVSRA